MAEDIDRKDRAGAPLWMRLLLIASLGLNLAVAGMVIGAVSSGGGPGQARDAVREARNTPFIRALDPDDRRGLAREMIKDREALRESRETLRARFDALLVALRAETFDVEVVEGLLEDQRSAAQARNQVGENAILRLIAEMSLEDRRAYADRLEETVKRRPPPRQ